MSLSLSILDGTPNLGNTSYMTEKLAHHEFVRWWLVNLDDGMRHVKQESVGVGSVRAKLLIEPWRYGSLGQKCERHPSLMGGGGERGRGRRPGQFKSGRRCKIGVPPRYRRK